MKFNRQNGFTLIELIMVIVILGILAVVALPKFADLSGDARKATITGAQGAVKSAAGIVHAKALVEGKTATGDSSEVVILEGVKIALVYGYPAAASISDASGISSTEYHVKTEKNVTTISASKDGGSNPVEKCNFTYTEPSGANNAPTVSDVVSGGC